MIYRLHAKIHLIVLFFCTLLTSSLRGMEFNNQTGACSFDEVIDTGTCSFDEVIDTVSSSDSAGLSRWRIVSHSCPINDSNMKFTELKDAIPSNWNEFIGNFHRTFRELLGGESDPHRMVSSYCQHLGHKNELALYDCSKYDLETDCYLPVRAVSCDDIRDYKKLETQFFGYRMLFFLPIIAGPSAYLVNKLSFGCIPQKHCKIVLDTLATGILVLAYAGYCYGYWTTDSIFDPTKFALFVTNVISMFFAAFRLLNASELQSLSIQDFCIQVMLMIGAGLFPQWAPEDLIKNHDVALGSTFFSILAQFHSNWVTKNIHLTCTKIKAFVSWLYSGCCFGKAKIA